MVKLLDSDTNCGIGSPGKSVTTKTFFFYRWAEKTKEHKHRRKKVNNDLQREYLSISDNNYQTTPGSN